MRSDYIKWAGNVIAVLGIIGSLILMFYREGSGIYYTSEPQIGLGIGCIISSILLCLVCHWMAWMLDYSRERVGLLNEIIEELKKNK